MANALNINTATTEPGFPNTNVTSLPTRSPGARSPWKL
jgi:hypothetical protein